MILRRLNCVTRILVTVLAFLSLSKLAAATTVAGSVDVTSPEGQDLSLKMTIDEVNTRFELTGPAFSWFAFGFDTTTMRGYSIIIEGIADTRSVVEQNLVRIGNPGGPQLTQNLDFLDLIHDADNNLTTVVLKRANTTGDVDDPVFSPSMTSLNLIYAYDGVATPEDPSPTLNNHGDGARGFATITFAPVVPEPASLALLAFGSALGLATARRQQCYRKS